MGILTLLRRAGDMSPLAFTAIYAGCILVAFVGLSLFPASIVLSVILTPLWILANLLLWIVVIWFRDDDWMMGAVQIVLATFVTNLLAQLFVAGVVHRSVSAVSPRRRSYRSRADLDRGADQAGRRPELSPLPLSGTSVGLP